ncbi:hypothetical protein N6H18_03205 [Reichenbachiella agarivorans]|uniref:Uncharacterized protein n=1 Tax=Reichenbachiella agarivorans TaxID=2979464 RepID=A0ABY6CR23_9BACT|nr:hypothetical protein [Reichenbachiella agarivorans]UXP32962.1 hypothetical protein N6H18_03205 [Reichenbachiella agarivorans]
MENQVQKCVPLLLAHFQLPENELVLREHTSEELEQKLSKIIEYLLNHDLDRLMSTCYKIDLSEQIFKEIITTAAPEEINLSLAREIIKRESQKVITREKYRDLL